MLVLNGRVWRPKKINGYKPDWETEDGIYEAKTRNWTTSGTAGEKILAMGPRIVMIKNGEYGVYLTCKEGQFALPAFPASQVKDPTGAGDSFAGGVMGYLAAKDDISFNSLKQAMVYGTLIASFNIEDFSLERFKRLKRSDIDERYKEFISFFTL